MIAAGFVMSFSATALALSAITRIFDFDPNILRTAATVLLLGFGLLMIWPAPFEWLSIRLNGLIGSGPAGSVASRQGNLGGFVLGTTLGLVWTPCAGPVLGSILTVVATSKDTAWASVLLVVYAHRRRDPDAGDRLWRPGRHHPRAQHRARSRPDCSRASASS